MCSWYDTLGHVKVLGCYVYHPAFHCVWYDSWDKVQFVTFGDLVRELLSSSSSRGMSSLASLPTLSFSVRLIVASVLQRSLSYSSSSFQLSNASRVLCWMRVMTDRPWQTLPNDIPIILFFFSPKIQPINLSNQPIILDYYQSVAKKGENIIRLTTYSQKR